MLFSKSESNKSRTIEGLIPMVDLFAVLAIVFMIYSSDEIIASQEKSQEIIEQIEIEHKNLQEEVAATEQARQERREILATNAVKSLEEIQVERKQKAQQLVQEFTQMLAEQQSQASVEYEALVAKFEQEHEQEVEQQKANLKAEKQQEVQSKLAQLEQEKEAEVSAAKQQFEQVISVQEQQLEKTTQAVIAIEMQRVEDLSQQQAKLAQQQVMQVAMVKMESTEALAQQKSQMEAQEQAASQQAAQEAQATAEAAAQAAAEEAKQQAESEAKQSLKQELAAQQERLEAQQAQQMAAAQAAAEQSKQQAVSQELAAQQERLEAQKAQELAQAESDAQELAKAAAAAAEQEVRKTAKQQAEAEVESEHAQEMQQQLAQLEAQKDAEIQPYLEEEQAKKEAQKAREQIVNNLVKNFKDSEDGDVGIDEKTGKVRINFQESYFVRGSAELSEHMKDLLRTMIPKYAKSIYEVAEAAKQVESLEISGLTSPIFRGKYFDIDDTSPEGEEAREYNLKLSNDRALVMYNFIFNAEEMGDYQYRAQLKADLGISAQGYRTATPVPAELVGQKAKCLQYDCKKEQASILEFRLYSEY